MFRVGLTATGACGEEAIVDVGRYECTFTTKVQITWNIAETFKVLKSMTRMFWGPVRGKTKEARCEVGD